MKHDIITRPLLLFLRHTADLSFSLSLSLSRAHLLSPFCYWALSSRRRSIDAVTTGAAVDCAPAVETIAISEKIRKREGDPTESLRGTRETAVKQSFGHTMATEQLLAPY
jgi:hypothetical protein